MNMQIFWGAWLALIFLTFAAGEAYGLHTHGVPGTFSYFMTTMNQRWGLWGPVWGILMGGLFVHFWWSRSY